MTRDSAPVWLVVALAACGSSSSPPAPDAGAPDAASPARVATGRRLIDHAAVVGGITADGYVVYSELDAAGHTVAKVISIDGGDPTVITASTGTGKADLRFAIQGHVVFVWADRGNRVATLTVWSPATGVVARGDNIRPGRAAATADGTMIAYERDITDTTATLVGGPTAGGETVIAMANAQDDACWRDTDIASLGQVAPRLIVRYCPAGATAFTLRSVGTGGAMTDLSTAAVSAAYGSARTIWRDASGTLSSTTDGVTADTLASKVTSVSLSHDASALAYLTTDGAIFGMPSDRSAAAHPLVAAPQVASQLGALSPDGQTVLYATQSATHGKDDVQPSTDVVVAGPLGARTLVPGTTSCPGCLFDSFTPDGRYALVLDPIDNSQAADGSGPIKVIDLMDGSTATSFGSDIYTAYALGGAGAASRFMFVDAVRDTTLSTGWVYGMTTRDLLPGAAVTEVARGAENFATDRAHGRGVVSFSSNGIDDVAGLWVIELK